jgi:phage baseplate assembly protein W
MPSTTARFPFAVSPEGRILLCSGDEAIRAKVIQVLFTAPGERVHQPDFGCGLFNLVFEPNDELLAASVEFTVGQALTRWLRNDIVVDAVKATSSEATITIEVAYIKKTDLTRQAVRVHFR